MFDSHCHIQFKAFQDDRGDVLDRCKEEGMLLAAIGTQYKTSKDAIHLAETHQFVYATVGLHPIQQYVCTVNEETSKFTTIGEHFDKEAYAALARHPKVVAIGETGIDRYHIPDDIPIEEVIDEQKAVFRKHCELSHELGLPLVIHARDAAPQSAHEKKSAHEDIIEVLESLPFTVRGVMHCFSGPKNVAETYIKYGFCLGFTGVVTYPPKKSDPKAQEDLLAVVDSIPLEQLLVETDSPYLAPIPYRGKRAEPWMVEEVLRFIAPRRGLTFDQLRQITTTNAKRLFAIPE